MHSCAGSSVRFVDAGPEQIGATSARRRIRGGALPRLAIDSSIPSYCGPIFVSYQLAFVIDLAEVCAWNQISFCAAAFSIVHRYRFSATFVLQILIATKWSESESVATR